MVIHSVTPIELLMPQMGAQNLVTKPFDRGFISGYDTPQGFAIANVISTDLSVYLDDKFSPGKIYHAPAKL